MPGAVMKSRVHFGTTLFNGSAIMGSSVWYVWLASRANLAKAGTVPWFTITDNRVHH